jgi:predicted esterase
MVAVEPQGKPRCFISHGQYDPVLPIDRCSRRLVPQLQEAGYDVRYQEFGDGHTVPVGISRQALGWLTDDDEQSVTLTS